MRPNPAGHPKTWAEVCFGNDAAQEKTGTVAEIHLDGPDEETVDTRELPVESNENVSLEDAQSIDAWFRDLY